MEDFEMPVETTASKIAGAEAMIAQMERMIAENHRQIELGDDVEGRQNMIKHLTNCIAEEQEKIARLKAE